MRKLILALLLVLVCASGSRAQAPVLPGTQTLINGLPNFQPYSASNPLPVAGSGVANVILAGTTITRPNNTTAYAANECVGDAGNCIFTFTNAWSTLGKTGFITGLRVTVVKASIGTANMPNLVGHLYMTSPTAPASDQSAFNYLSANQAIEIGTITFSQWNIANSGSDLIDSYGTPVFTPLPAKSDGATRNLFLILATTSAATPLATMAITPYLSTLEN